MGDTDWNGSGMHANFSNGKMRDQGGETYFTTVCEAFGNYIQEHIDVYGADNHMRLTGKHETQSIDKYSMVCLIGVHQSVFQLVLLKMDG